jgi:hypothetical protein
MPEYIPLVPPVPAIQLGRYFSAGGSFEIARRGRLRYESCSIGRSARAGRLFLGHFRRMGSASTATFRDHPSDQAGTRSADRRAEAGSTKVPTEEEGASLDELAAKVAR